MYSVHIFLPDKAWYLNIKEQESSLDLNDSCIFFIDLFIIDYVFIIGKKDDKVHQTSKIQYQNVTTVESSAWGS